MVPRSPSERTVLVRRLAAELGFDGSGVASAAPLDDTPLIAWLSRGHAGGMTYLKAPRNDPRRVMAGVRSIVCLVLSYYRTTPRGSGRGTPGVRGRVARYARGADYHDVMKAKIRLLADRLLERFPAARFRAVVDTAPLLEKALAIRAGLGWAGRHSLVIHPPFGSWVVLGELMTDLDLASDGPVPDRCGACARCLAACPTGALTGPQVLDARRCIAYLTIEHRGPIPRELRPMMGDRVFGCDACQEACPWNRRVREGREAGLASRVEAGQPLLTDLPGLDEAAFAARFGGTPLARVGRAGLARNACVALGNSGDARARGCLEAALRDADPVIRGHAAWALGRLVSLSRAGTDGGRFRSSPAGSVRGLREDEATSLSKVLSAAARRERDRDALDEMRSAAASCCFY